jgi:hypothetical protein
MKARGPVPTLALREVPPLAAPPYDGRFEVITLPHTAKWRILGVAVRAATRGLGPRSTAKRYAFTTLIPIPLPAHRSGSASPLAAWRLTLG